MLFYSKVAYLILKKKLLKFLKQNKAKTGRFCFKFKFSLEGGGIICNTPPIASTLYMIIIDCEEYPSVFRIAKLVKL